MSLDKMERFIARIRRGFRLRTVTEETDNHSRPTDENSAPDINHGADVSDNGKYIPSLSCGPYLHISQCVTGAPIRMGNQTYSNTSFPFPPEVNWSTYPRREPTDQMLNGAAPPRPPKKSPSVSSATFNGNVAIPTRISENADDGNDSSSTSSLHSPPGSAGGLYSNVPDMSPIQKSPNEPPVSHSLPSSGDANFLSPVSPPKVDRNLKPGLRRPGESPSYASQQSPNGNLNAQYPSGTKTLPLRNNQRVVQSTPDQQNKLPPKFKLDPTPAQKRTLGNSETKLASPKSNVSSTLPARGKKSVGSSHDQIPQQELTYLVIDCGANVAEGIPKTPTIHHPTHQRSQSVSHATIYSSSVEYTLIDRERTEALNATLKDHQLLRTTHTNKHVK